MTPSAMLQLGLTDLRWIWRTRWIGFGFLLFVAAGWGAIQLGRRDFDAQQESYAEAIQIRSQVQVRGSGRVSGRAAEPGLRVIRPPNPGQILVLGTQLLPAAWEATPAGAEGLPSYPTTRQWDTAGVWDLEFLVRMVISLLALGMGLAGVLAMRSSGWDQATRTFPLSATTLVAAQIVGRCALLAALIWASWVVLARVVATSAPIAGEAIWPLVLPAILTAWAFFGIGTALAWRIPSGVRSTFAAFGVWLGLSVVAPSLISLAAAIAQPVPPQASVERERREQYADGLRAAERTVAEHLAARLPAGVAATNAASAAAREFPHVETEWLGALRTLRIAERDLTLDWQGHVDAQRGLARRLAWLSPGALARTALAELAGSGSGYDRAWAQAVASYQSELNRQLFDDRPRANLPVPIGSGLQLMAFDRREPPRFGDLPAFQPPGGSWRTRFSDAAAALVGLAIWATLALAVAYSFGMAALRDPSAPSSSPRP